MLSTFVGRDAERHHLDRLTTASPRCITVVGPGGMGKTRLVTEWMRLSPQNVRFCHAGSAGNRDDLIAAVARALDLSFGPDTEASLLAALDRIDVLLLDNIEQLAPCPEALELISTWLAQTPRLRILTTSRIATGLSDEVVLELGPLSTPAARALFVDRAQQLSAQSLAPTPLLDTLVNTLDGIPLALEIVASQLDLLDISAVLAHLNHHLDFHNTHPTQPHHSTLRSVLESSFARLSPDEKSVFASCAIFPSPFTVEAAAAATQLPLPTLLSAIRGLRKRSLLRHHPGSPPRLSYYETLRAFAVEQRPPEAHHPLYESALLHYSTLDHDEQLLDERDNLLHLVRYSLDHSAPSEALFRAACALAHVLTLQGPLSPLHSILDSLLSAPPPGPSSAALYLARGRLRCILGQLESSACDLQAGLAQLNASPSVLKGRLHATLGRVLGLLGEPDEAQDQLLKASACLEAFSDRSDLLEDRIRLHSISGALHHEAAHYHEADVQMRAALDLSRSRNPRQTAILLSNLGVNEQARGRYRQAREHLLAALDLHLELEQPRFAAVSQLDLARLDFESGALLNARDGFQQAHRALSQVGTPKMASLAALGLAAVQAEMGEGWRYAGPSVPLTPLYALHQEIRAMVESGSANWAAMRTHIDAEAQRLMATQHDEAMLAARLAHQAIARALQAENALRVMIQTQSLQLPNNGSLISLSHRATLWRMFWALVRHRLDHPGAALSPDALVEHTWPGEQILESAARNRVRVALSTLRKLGLRDVILTVDGGYLISEELPVSCT